MFGGGHRLDRRADHLRRDQAGAGAEPHRGRPDLRHPAGLRRPQPDVGRGRCDGAGAGPGVGPPGRPDHAGPAAAGGLRDGGDRPGAPAAGVRRGRPVVRGHRAGGARDRRSGHGGRPYRSPGGGPVPALGCRQQDVAADRRRQGGVPEPGGDRLGRGGRRERPAPGADRGQRPRTRAGHPLRPRRPGHAHPFGTEGARRAHRAGRRLPEAPGPRGRTAEQRPVLGRSGLLDRAGRTRPPGAACAAACAGADATRRSRGGHLAVRRDAGAHRGERPGHRVLCERGPDRTAQLVRGLPALLFIGDEGGATLPGFDLSPRTPPGSPGPRRSYWPSPWARRCSREPGWYARCTR